MTKAMAIKARELKKGDLFVALGRWHVVFDFTIDPATDIVTIPHGDGGYTTVPGDVTIGVRREV